MICPMQLLLNFGNKLIFIGIVIVVVYTTSDQKNKKTHMNNRKYIWDQDQDCKQMITSDQNSNDYC